MNQVLHLYAQSIWHDEARIAGTEDELKELAAAINQAIRKGESTMKTFCVDGEGYDLHINCVKDTDKLPVPYTDEMAQGSLESYQKAPWHAKTKKKAGL